MQPQCEEGEEGEDGEFIVMIRPKPIWVFADSLWHPSYEWRLFTSIHKDNHVLPVIDSHQVTIDGRTHDLVCTRSYADLNELLSQTDSPVCVNWLANHINEFMTQSGFYDHAPISAETMDRIKGRDS